ncbi:hypothetical protein [Streptomyces sp. WMMC897]|uniref:hypothetical protein n=1 Tax=Streptomyces sp. WMMC897 TaxID=3014782 RepID=UPI0022B66056|nr:hypothetical protein [Streptomyces sp. WMMC897]MCZ7417569.1 hypothetical protein [Streptomyces sp. WMMC897]
MSQIPMCPLEQITADELAMRAAADAARALLTGHPDLPVSAARIMTYDGIEIHLRLPDADAVHAWAERLSLGLTGLIPIRQTTEASACSSGYVYEHVDAKATVRGHRVVLHSCRILPEDEAAAWRAAQARPGTETTS